MGGLWEFPGGRVEPGETDRQALKRELLEEVGIRVRCCSPLLAFDYDYPDRSLHFCIRNVDDWEGQARSDTGQQLEWLPLSSLAQRAFPAANKGMIAACRLPAAYLITPDLDHYSDDFLDELNRHVEAGFRLIQFRCKRSKPETHAGAIRLALDRVRSLGAELLINGSPAFALQAGAAGMQLDSASLMRLAQRPLPADRWVGASCHNRRELQHAVRIGVDFCVLSPVRQPSSPGKAHYSSADLLGWQGFSSLVRDVPLPVYALGGMRRADLETAREHGAQGVALIGDVWGTGSGPAAAG